MKIALNTTIATPRRTGTGHYAVNLAIAILQLESGHDLLIYCNKKLRGLFEQSRDRNGQELRAVPVNSAVSRICWEQLMLKRHLRKQDVDLLHSMSFSSPWFGSGKTVVTVHDLAFLRYPDTIPPVRRRYYQALFTRSLKQAEAIITPTETVREEVLEAYNLAPDIVTVVHEAVSAIYFRRIDADEIESTLNKYGITTPYLLTVGTLEPRKNLRTIIDAFQRLKQHGHPHTLAIVGGKRRGRLGRANLEWLNRVPGGVVFTGYVAQQDLPALYAGADSFLYPSLYEGFGVPLLEAFASGVPVLASDIPAHREVCGSCALFIESQNVEHWSTQMQHLSGNREKRQELRQKARRRAMQFTWQRAAERTLAVYERVGANGQA